MSKRPELFAVTGKPVLHSLSPDMMNAAFSRAGDKAFYTRLYGHSAEEIMQSMLTLGLKGINVTAPYKKEMIQYVDHTDMSVKYTGALNTIVRQKGTLVAYNTDFLGVMNSFKELRYFLAGRKILVIGAGGAASAAAFGLRQNYANVTIVNRTFEKAEKLAKVFNANAITMDELERGVRIADCIINTVADNKIKIAPEWLRNDHYVFDANYKNSSLLDAAQQAGAKIIPGEKWLLNQAIPAYYIFRGKQPNVLAMRGAVSESITEMPEEIVLFSDTQIDADLLHSLQEMTGLPVSDGNKLDIFSERAVYELKGKYLKILLFSDHYPENMTLNDEAFWKFKFVDFVIPRRLRKNNQLSTIIYEEISKAFNI